MIKITFLPDKKNIKVNKGTTILEALESVEININVPCGGKGICGKCKILISEHGAKKVELETLLHQSDYISLHYPLNKSTKYLIDFKEIEIMKKGVFIINTSRGEIINQKALYKALKNGKIAGAALDVLEKDPPALTDIMNTDNLIYTPHVAWNSVEAETELRKSAAQEVKRVLKGGKPLNLVNKEVLKYFQ